MLSSNVAKKRKQIDPQVTMYCWDDHCWRYLHYTWFPFAAYTRCIFQKRI